MFRLDDRARWLARHVLPHEPALRAWLLRRAVPGLEIDDVVQETYARLAQLPSTEGIRDPRPYLFRTAWSVMVSHIRHARVVPIHSLAQLESVEFIDELPDPETIVVDRDELRRLGAAIATLPPRIREVFLLRRVEGLSQREVAQRLGLSESTVEKQMSQGFHRIAAMIGRGGKQHGRASRGAGRTIQDDHDATDRTGD